ncbi:hypothetical protein [Acidisphaera sp. L21]|uniref:hypothetical protein n=1 Tax=Acidisphaera sp. L21 TaxID=1641851 RepID=UPI00131D697A|nr:hypothetical protein [Acidisphaera sp. L21]
MQTRPIQHDDIAQAPALFREALAELVQIGMSVARMVGRAAEAETALADAAIVVAGELPIATSLAEAIAADQAASAAAEARRTVAPRIEIVAAAFNQVSRAIRRTVLLAERLDRGWARPVRMDDQQAMARRQIVRAVSHAIGRSADAGDAERLTGALRERLDALDTIEDIGRRPAEEIIREICRDLGLDPAPVLASTPSSRAVPPMAFHSPRTPLDPSG